MKGRRGRIGNGILSVIDRGVLRGSAAVCLVILSGSVWADQTISTYQTVPVNSNGNENVQVTDSGFIDIAAAGSSNYALRLTGDLAVGKRILNDGRIETRLDSSGGVHSVPLHLNITSHGEIVNNGTIVSRVADGQWAYPLYLKVNAVDGIVRNNGAIYSLSEQNAWGVALHVRTNDGRVINAPGATLTLRGKDGSWLYGFAAITNRAGGTLVNRGTIETHSEGVGGGGVGLYAYYNYGDVINEGSAEISKSGTNQELYGISVIHNYGTIRNRGRIIPQSSTENDVWAFETDDGNGTVINDTGAQAYGDIHTAGQHFENRGALHLFSKNASQTDYYRGYSGSILGINVALDNAHHPLYSTLQTKGTILESGTEIHVNVQTPAADQHYLLGERLDGVIHTDNNLTVLAAPIVTDNSALLGWYPEYDTTDLDLVPYREVSFSEAARRGACTLGALGVAGTLDGYLYGADSDLDAFVNTLYVRPEISQVAEGLHSAIPYASLQSVVANREISRRLMSRLRSRMPDEAFWDLNQSRSLWLELFGGRLRQPCDNGYRGYDADFSGVMIGEDRQAGPGHRLGLALMLGRGELQTRGLPQSVDFDRYDLMIYGLYLPGSGWRLHYQGGLGYVRGREDRRLLYLDRHASARHHEWTGYMSAELSRIFYRKGGLELESGATVSFLYGDLHRFAEGGAGGLDVAVAGFSDRALLVGWRGGLRYTLPGDLKLEAEVGIDYDLLHRPLRTEGSFRGFPSAHFPLELDYGSAWGYRMNFSLSKRVAHNAELTLTMGYSGREGGYRDYDFTAGVRWRF